MSRPRPLVFALLLASTSLSQAAEEKIDCPGTAEKGQALRDEKKLKAAREMFLKCATNKCPKLIRNDCANLFLPQVEAAIPTVVLRARDEKGNDLVDVRVTVDGATVADKLAGAALSMDPGPHLFTFEANGRKVEQRVVVGEGEKNRVISVDIKPPAPEPKPAPAPPPPSPEPEAPAPAAGSRTLAYGLIGVGVVSLGAFAGLQLWARSQKSDLEAGCGASRTCSDDELGPARTKFVLSGVALGVGAAAVAVGAGVLIFSDKPSGTALSVQPALGGASLSLGGRFF